MVNYVPPKYWTFRMTVNLVPREDTNAINNPPQVTGTPVKILSKGCRRTNITIPAIDSDGDEVRCRWVQLRKGECETNCGGTSSQIDWSLENTAAGCQLSVNPRRSTVGWYGVPIMFEDFNRKGEVLSSVPFQFMLRIVGKRSCPKPEIVSSLPDCLMRPVGEDFSITLTARAVTPGSRIRSIMTTGLLGMHKSEIRAVPERPQESSVIVTWTPPSSEEGRTNTLCYQPEDSNGFQGEMTCISLLVGDATAISGPIPDPITSRPSSGRKIHKSESVFMIRFDKSIKRPTAGSEIRLLRADGSHLLTVPVEPAGGGHDEAVVYYDNEIVFAIPEERLQEKQTYRIELPEGLAGEPGTEACRLPSEAASWDFTVVGDYKATPEKPTIRKPAPHCYESYMEIFILKMMVPYEDPKHVYFREPACIACVYNATHFVMRTDYQFCGTNIEPQRGNGALVTNDIRIIQDTVGQSDSVTRSGGSLIHIVCRADHVIFVSLDTDIEVMAEDTWDGSIAVYNYSLMLYGDNAYTSPYGYSSYPVQAPLGEKLYFKASTERIGNRRREIYLRSCTATPYPNPGDLLSHQFIDNNCPEDDTVTIQRISREEIQFSIESFAFLHHFTSESISVYCKVWLRSHGDGPPCPVVRTRRYAWPK
ncbi:uncharacterized protein LOC121416605 [Lytechinus variegatus]|uniref:uncharacterized protein LOC121416605 n=1 Tax=Lytechinus variegatus TaxID=7654 RepID=UPI001BB18A19|nr:uncharacterized protein LOC121416605 [Lytechinus variegatus]